MNHSTIPIPIPTTAYSVQRSSACTADIGGGAIALPLLDYVQLHWPRLLRYRRLDIVVARGECSPPMTAELFVGDEFRRGNTRYIDIVLRALASELVPTVLIFDKTSRLLIASEINDIDLHACIVSAGAVAETMA